MDKLSRIVQNVLNLAADLRPSSSNAKGTPVIEVRNARRTSTTDASNGGGRDVVEEVDGEEMVSLLCSVLGAGLHSGLTVWDVVLQLDRLPDFVDVFMAPLSFPALTAMRESLKSQQEHASHPTRAIEDVEDLTLSPELVRILSIWARKTARDDPLFHDPVAVGGRRPARGIQTKFVKQMVTMVKNVDAPPPLRARVFFRCALKLRSLTATLEALCCLPSIGSSLYEPSGFFRDPAAIASLLEIVAPIGGASLRVRAAVDLFGMHELLSGKTVMAEDDLVAMVHNSEATRSSEAMARNITDPDAQVEVAFLCATVSEARDVLRSFVVSMAHCYAPRIVMAMDLQLPTDREIYSTPPLASRGTPAAVPDGERVRARTVFGEPVPSDLDGTGIVVQRRRRAGTLTKPAPAPTSPVRTAREASVRNKKALSPAPKCALHDAPSGTPSAPLAAHPAVVTSGGANSERPPSRTPRAADVERPSDSVVESVTPRANFVASDSVASAIEFSDEEKASLQASAEVQQALDERVAALHAFVGRRDERARAVAAQVEPLLVLYESIIDRVLAQAFIDARCRESEMMEMLDRDAGATAAATSVRRARN